MGDVIHTLPAVQALREAFPDAIIDWLIEERWAELLCAAGTPRRKPLSTRRPLVDWVHTANLRGWRKSLFTTHTALEAVRLWNDVRSRNYDVAFDLQGAIRSALLARWSGAKVVIGAAQPRETPASLVYMRRVITRGTHVIEQNLSIVEEFVQKKLTPPRAVLPRDAVVEQTVARDLLQHGIRDYAILNPGAGWGAKRWPAERYGEVARQLHKDGLRCLVNCGPGEEELFNAVNAASGAVVLPTKPSITGLIALMRRAKVFIGGDTGPLHMAAALQVPVVAIFGPTDPARNGPYGTESVVLRSPSSVTSHARLARPEEGLLEISVDSVVAAARKLLQGSADADRSVRATRDGAHG